MLARDAEEGIGAFMDKRAPVWEGESPFRIEREEPVSCVGEGQGEVRTANQSS